MAKNAPVNPEISDDEFDEIEVGLGREWEIESRDGPIYGKFLGTAMTQITDKRSGEIRDTTAYLFSVDGERRFIWGGYQLDQGFQKINPGQMVKVTFTGRDNFSADDGPRQVKTYRIQVKKGS